jgi:hypothetical protein
MLGRKNSHPSVCSARVTRARAHGGSDRLDFERVKDASRPRKGLRPPEFGTHLILDPLSPVVRTGHTKEAVVNLEQQKKKARELLRAIRSGNAEASARLRRYHQRWQGVDEATLRQQVALHDAQFALAREQGFASWPKLKAYAEPASHSRVCHLFVPDVQWISDRVAGLLRTRKSAGPAALEQIREWHPRFADSSDHEILEAAFTEEDARIVYAREHGFDAWSDLVERVSALSRTVAEAIPSSEPFMAAFHYLQRGDSARASSRAFTSTRQQREHAHEPGGQSCAKDGTPMPVDHRHTGNKRR